MSLSILAILLGLGYGLPQLFGLAQPERFRAALRCFPRSEPIGYALTLAATGWFLWNLHRENISDFAAFKPILMVGFAAVGIGACIVLRDFLAVRGLAVLFLLLAKLMVDSARWAESEWRVAVVIWAYVLVVVGMWLTVAPWRFRDWLDWLTVSDTRLRAGCGIRLALGLGIAVLGFTEFRT